MMKNKYNIIGMSCSACVAHVQKAVEKVDGVTEVKVNLVTNTMEVVSQSDLSQQIISAVSASGYKATPFVVGKYEKKSNFVKIRLYASIALLVLLLYVSMGSMIGAPLPDFLTGMDNAFNFALAQLIILIPIIALNFNYFSSGFSKLVKFHPNMDSLVALGSTASLLYGIFALVMIAKGLASGNMEVVSRYHMDLYFESAGTILTLVTVGKYIEANSKSRTAQAVAKLLDLGGKTAVKVDNGVEMVIDADKIQVGDLLKVTAGGNFAVDGIITEGSASVNQASITGESLPVNKTVGQSVTSGTTNTDGVIIYRATTTTTNSTLAQIVELVDGAGNSKAPIAKLADKISSIFVPVVMGISLVTFVVWLIAEGQFELALSRAIAVLVISCPCALGLATPIAVMIGTGIASKNHILIKSAESLQSLSGITTVVMDKTGTITSGKLMVDKVVSLQKNFLDVVYTLENSSSHPVALAVIEYASATKAEILPVVNFSVVAGSGLTGEIEGKKYYCGNANYVSNFCQIPKVIVIDTTAVFVSDEKNLLGYLTLTDSVKDTSKKAVEAFKQMQLKTLILTGDNKAVAERVRAEVGADKVEAETNPIQKAEIVRNLIENGEKVLMIGDGINDAVALQYATVGMAIGAGSDIAIDSADVILRRSDLLDAVDAVRLSRKTMEIIKANLFWAFFYNAVSIPIAAGVLYPLWQISLSPAIASLAMSISSVTVVLNALRLNNFKKTEVNDMKTIIKVKGMMCAMCVSHVEKALRALPSVTDVKVELKSGKVEITASAPLDLAVVSKAISDAGYELVK